MSQSRFEWKVGLFVLVGLVLMGALLMVFSRGITFFRPTYDIYMKTEHVGGLRAGAQVLMSGIPVGTVVDSELAPDGRSVYVRLRILERFRIHADAQFVIDSLGLLGDQYVAIRPLENREPILEDGDVAEGLEPFNFQEVARASLGFIQRIDKTAEKLNEAITRVNQMVLDEQTLAELSGTISNFRTASDRALKTFDEVDRLIKTSGEPFSVSMTNFVRFSEQLNELADDLNATLTRSEDNFAGAINNLEAASYNVKLMVADAQAGKGALGSLLVDEDLDRNLRELVENLTVLSSNLNRHGLLYRPRQPRGEAESDGIIRRFFFPGRQ